MRCRLSPHVHVTGGITTRAAELLPKDFAALCDAAGEAGFVFASMGTTATPGVPSLFAELGCVWT